MAVPPAEPHRACATAGAVWAAVGSCADRWRELAGRPGLDLVVAVVPRGEAAFQPVKEESADRTGALGLLVVDHPDPEARLALLELARARRPAPLVIVVLPRGDVVAAVQAVRAGAFDCVEEPVSPERLRAVLAAASLATAIDLEARDLGVDVARRSGEKLILGNAASLRDVVRTIGRVAPARTTVLITGESGTGKDLVARALHEQSPRSGHALTSVNCAAIPAALLESELFGHERGAFTGADALKPGLFELAHLGTIFLDEIGDLRIDLQAKLLRVVENGEFHRIGGTRPVRVDVRVVAATNRDLEAAVAEGRFRRDLFHRLDVVRIHLPPLRERIEDLELLLDHFLRAKAAARRVPARRVSRRALEILRAHPWPGNVRELENLVERLLLLEGDGAIVAADLPFSVRRAARAASREERVLRGEHTLGQAVAEFEREVIGRAFAACGFNQTRTARRLGVSRRVLKYRMDQLGIAAEPAPGGDRRDVDPASPGLP